MNPGETATLFIYRARPVRVIDGDTIVVLIDHGMRIYSEQHLRLAGVDAPEIYRGTDEEKSEGQAAKGWLDDLLSSLPGGWPLLVKTYKDRRSFNRYVADIYVVNDDGVVQGCLNKMIVEAGHGEWV